MGRDPAISSEDLDEQRLRRLIEVGRALVSELDLESCSTQVLDVGRELTGARYAALGVLDESRRELERFLTRGIDAATHRAIGDLPRGRGILGVLIEEPRRCACTTSAHHPRSYGFPAGPPADAQLPRRADPDPRRGVGQPLPDREGAAATSTRPTSETAVSSPTGPAIAIENARLYRASHARRDELEQRGAADARGDDRDRPRRRRRDATSTACSS